MATGAVSTSIPLKVTFEGLNEANLHAMKGLNRLTLPLRYQVRVWLVHLAMASAVQVTVPAFSAYVAEHVSVTQDRVAKSCFWQCACVPCSPGFMKPWCAVATYLNCALRRVESA